MLFELHFQTLARFLMETSEESVQLNELTLADVLTNLFVR